jgi:hypothetical protein
MPAPSAVSQAVAALAILSARVGAPPTATLPPLAPATLAASPLTAPLRPAAAFAPALAAAAAEPSVPASVPEAAAPAVPPAALPASPPAAAEPAAQARGAAIARTARAAAALLVDALAGRARPLPPTEAFLREDLSYAASAKRAALGDGALVAADDPRRAPDRISYDHPGVLDFSGRVAALKARAKSGPELLDGLRALLRAEAARPGAALAARALERRRARQARAVELGAALQAGALDQRRLALAAHLALKLAGFSPKLARLKADGGERLSNLIHVDGAQVVFDPGAPALDGRKLSELTSSGAAAELDGPLAYNPSGKPKTGGVTAGVPELPAFAVTGRSAAERIFKDEARSYAAAAPDEAVRIEWLYLPFYVDGHSVLRVGDQVYEYRPKGWRVQSARAYLFNNPFFDAQYARHREDGMPPFGLGLSLSLSKRAADALVARIERERDSGWPKFSYWLNNCNQRPLAFLRRAGVVGLPDGLFTRFSSIRTFRLLLQAPPLGAGQARLYPLPGRVGPLEPYGPAVPRELREQRPGWRDALYFFRLWPRFAADKLARFRRLLKG